MRSAAAAFPAAAAGPVCRQHSGLPSRLPVWRADQLDARAGDGDAARRSTGHAALDAELPGGGWPSSGLTELLLAAPGCGEVRLLAPAFATTSTLWVAPPFTPYAPALSVLGFALDRLVIITPDNATDAAWAAEQALRSRALGAVLWWESGALPPATLRRLHLAAEEGSTPLLALRPSMARVQSSPAPLRLALEAAGSSALAVEVFKRRGPPMAAPLRLALPGPALQRSHRKPTLASRETHAVVRAAPERVAA